MFSDFTKKVLVFLSVLPLASCSLFSDSKELPQGERISVLTSSENAYDFNSARNIIIPEAQTNIDWTQTGSNPQHLSGNFKSGSEMKKLWKKDFGKGSNKRSLLIASPVIYQSAVYVQDTKGTVSAFDLETGEALWSKEIKPQVKNETDNGTSGSGLAAGNNKIFAATGFGSVVAFDAWEGKELWRQEMNVPLRTAPSLCGNHLLQQTIDNKIIAYNAQTGSELWRHNAPAEETIITGNGSPACNLEKNFVIVGFSNGDIEALNLDIGYPLWSASLVNYKTFNPSGGLNSVKAAPVIDNETIYASGHNDHTAAVSYRTGEKLWERKIGSTNMPSISGDYMFMLNNNNELLALDKNSGQTLWQTTLLTEYDLKERSNIYLSGPVMINGRLLVTASNGVIYAYSPQTGAQIDKADIGEKLSTAPVVAKDIVIFMTDDAHIMAFK